jgi:hypothetical protein
MLTYNIHINTYTHIYKFLSDLDEDELRPREQPFAAFALPAPNPTRFHPYARFFSSWQFSPPTCSAIHLRRGSEIESSGRRWRWASRSRSRGSGCCFPSSSAFCGRGAARRAAAGSRRNSRSPVTGECWSWTRATLTRQCAPPISSSSTSTPPGAATASASPRR